MAIGNRVTRIEIIRPLDRDWPEFGERLRSIRYWSWKYANHIFSQYWVADEHDQVDPPKLAGSKAGFVGNEALNNNVAHGVFTWAWKTYSANRKNVRNGNAELPTPRRETMPIHFSQNSGGSARLEVTDQGNSYGLRQDEVIAHLPVGYQEKSRMDPEQDWWPVLLGTRRMDSGQRAVLDRILNGTYPQTNSLLKYDPRRKKWFLYVGYKILDLPDEPPEEWSNVIGLDFGIKNLIVAAERDGFRRLFLAKESKDLRRIKMRYWKEFNGVRKATTQGDFWKGHGRKRLTKPVKKLHRKVQRFQEDLAQKMSRRVVDFAVKCQTRTIQLEDVAATDDPEWQNSFFRRYGLNYASFESKLIYKAAEHGIDVVRVPAAYSSRACHRCEGVAWDFDFESRGKRGYPQFECPECGHSCDADFNAARNLASPGWTERSKEIQSYADELIAA